MAGIGVELNHIYEKNTITTNLIGYGYSTVITIAPMLLVILVIVLMVEFLGFSTVSYARRELFACTVLYIFIFSLLTAAPFNAVLSKYMSDVIYEERFEDILPCYYIGLLFNTIISCLLGIPFCIWEYYVGHVDIWFVFIGFCGYISLVFVFYTMLYLSICKDYKKITIFYFLGMLVSIVLSFLLVYIFSVDITFSMLLSLVVGFLLIACLEVAVVKCYFRENSNNYRSVLQYFKRYWKLIVTNFLYIFGLYIHNFVFWNTDLKMVVNNSFICAPPYDMATCLAMFTNISASVIFISRVEMHFHSRYKSYSEAVIGGRWADIEKTKNRMFRQLASELMNLARIQFIISVALYLIFVVVLPQYGFSGMVLRIYPSLAAGYFILFFMYGAIIFLYYFNDLTGSMLTSICFFIMTLVGSLWATTLSDIWYGIGLFIGAFSGWVIAYYRLRWVEKNIDAHIFCKGELLKRGKGKKPPEKVYDVYKDENRRRGHIFKGRKRI
ncbi:MAG: exopolysaccharide Pel transporter PelG [Velocimicrobium sp.]